MFDFWNNEAEVCRCDHCDRENECENIYCIYCGRPLPSEKEREARRKKSKSLRKCKCEKCKHSNDCNDEFCVKCGHSLKGTISDEELLEHVIASLDGIVMALMAKTAKVGGRIGKKEIEFFNNTFAIWGKKRSQSDQILTIYSKIMDSEKNNLSNIDTLCKKLSHMKIMRDLKIEIIRLFVELAFLDSNYQKRQEDIVLKMVKSLDIDPMIYQNIRHEFDPNDRGNSANADELTLELCYEILELTPGDTTQTQKTNYRRLVRQYHYDSIISKDLPKDMILFAEERLKRINAAYSMLKQQ